MIGRFATVLVFCETKRQGDWEREYHQVSGMTEPRSYEYHIHSKAMSLSTSRRPGAYPTSSVREVAREFQGELPEAPGIWYDGTKVL
jgi:hypothetical protein